MPPHDVYVEVFGGAASVLLAKPPSRLEILNDIDLAITTFYRVLRDPHKLERLLELLEYTPYSRPEWRECKDTLDEPDIDDVERARRFFVVAVQSFSGTPGRSWSMSACPKRSKGRAWRDSIDNLRAVHERLRHVQIECVDWSRIFDLYDRPRTLFYCDPPYIPDTREPNIYRHEMGAEEHERFIDRLLTLRGMAIVSGYDHPLYRRLEDNGWQRVEREFHAFSIARTRANNAIGRGTVSERGRRTEVLWLSPNCGKDTLFPHGAADGDHNGT